MTPTRRAAVAGGCAAAVLVLVGCAAAAEPEPIAGPDGSCRSSILEGIVPTTATVEIGPAAVLPTPLAELVARSEAECTGQMVVTAPGMELTGALAVFPDDASALIPTIDELLVDGWAGPWTDPDETTTTWGDDAGRTVVQVFVRESGGVVVAVAVSEED